MNMKQAISHQAIGFAIGFLATTFVIMPLLKNKLGSVVGNLTSVKTGTPVADNIERFQHSYKRMFAKRLECVVHSKESFREYANQHFDEACDAVREYALEHNVEVDTNKHTWAIGLYPCIERKENGKSQIGIYFIPTLALKGFDTMKPDDPGYATCILSYGDPVIKKKYYGNLDVAKYVDDLGHEIP